MRKLTARELAERGRGAGVSPFFDGSTGPPTGAGVSPFDEPGGAGVSPFVTILDRDDSPLLFDGSPPPWGGLEIKAGRAEPSHHFVGIFPRTEIGTDVSFEKGG